MECVSYMAIPELLSNKTKNYPLTKKFKFDDSYLQDTSESKSIHDSIYITMKDGGGV